MPTERGHYNYFDKEMIYAFLQLLYHQYFTTRFSPECDRNLELMSV